MKGNRSLSLLNTLTFRGQGGWGWEDIASFLGSSQVFLNDSTGSTQRYGWKCTLETGVFCAITLKF